MNITNKQSLLFLSIFIFLSQSVTADSIRLLQYDGVKITHTYEGKSKTVEIRRQIDPKCLELGISPNVVFGGDAANKSVPKACKKTFVTTLGSIQPIAIEGIKTVGELEVLEHIKKSAAFPDKYVLIDSRRSQWYEHATIPSAINIPYTDIIFDPDFPEDFEKLLTAFNIKKTAQDLDFSKAKTAVLFCNANWCVQSPKAIKILSALGYPRDKLLWYRGGMQDWEALGFNTIKGNLE
jgi:rhodanese-related sulfurtransferase